MESDLYSFIIDESSIMCLVLTSFQYLNVWLKVACLIGYKVI